MFSGISRQGVERFVTQHLPGSIFLIRGSVLNELEIIDLRLKWFSVTVFAHPLCTDEDIEAAKRTILEHHHGAQVWVDLLPHEVGPPYSSRS
jgi:hypothetical protein